MLTESKRSGKGVTMHVSDALGHYRSLAEKREPVKRPLGFSRPKMAEQALTLPVAVESSYWDAHYVVWAGDE